MHHLKIESEEERQAKLTAAVRERAATLKTMVEALTLGIDYAIISPETAEAMLAQQGIQNG